jgi:hypothetical protein
MFGRKINFFEKLLLPVGAGLTFFGFYLILRVDAVNTTNAWLKLLTIFVWIVMLLTVIVNAATEDMKEELALIQREHITEIKLLKEIVNDQLQEIKLLRQDLKKH